MSTMYVVPEWMDRLVDEAAFEGSEPVKLLGNEGRSAVWRMCEWFGCDARGVPGLACRLFERYLFCAFQQYTDADEEEEFRVTMRIQLPLLIASCITLASKMNSSVSQVTAKLVHMIFLCKTIPCTINEIVATESKVYNVLGFQIPLWTMVEVGETLAVEVGCPTELLRRVAILVDLAEYRRHAINRKVRWIANVSPACPIGGILSLHLTAGVVAAVAKSYKLGTDSLSRLALLTNAPKQYIRCIRGVIITEVFSKLPQYASGSRKRK